MLAQAGGRVVALDAAMGMLHQCSAKAQEAGLQGNVILTNASAGNLPYSDGSFDIVFSSRFLHLEFRVKSFNYYDLWLWGAL